MNLFSGVRDRGNLIVNDYSKLARLTKVLHELNLITVVTIGTFDMVHIGHSRYLERARSYGDFLIVGVDSDSAVKIYKDETRPMVPQDERMEMLLHTRHVDCTTLVDDVTAKGEWEYGLIKAVRPKVFVAVEDSYPEDQLEDIRGFCDVVEILQRQAETSTSETIRRALISQTKPFSDRLRAMADQIDSGDIQP